MKRLKFLTLFLFAIVLISCATSQKITKCKKYPFQELDSLQKTLRNVNYSIQNPEGWEKSAVSGKLYYVLKNKTSDEGIANLIIESDKIKTDCEVEINIDDYLNYFVEENKRYYKDHFNYIILSTNNKKYGKIYILKYSIKYSNYLGQKVDEKKIATFLLFKNNIGYNITFSSIPSIFDTHIGVTQKVLESFEIKE